MYDDSSSVNIMRGWGISCVYDNGKIIVNHSGWDSSIAYYTSVNMLDDTGKTIKQRIFRESGFVYAHSPGRISLIKTLDNKYIDVGIKKISTGTQYRSWGYMAKLDQNLDTLYTRYYRRSSWPLDSVWVSFVSVLQSPIDSSYYCLGLAQSTTSFIDSFLVAKYDKAGLFIWDKILSKSSDGWINGFWISDNIIFISGTKEQIWEPLLWIYIERNPYILKMDTSGNVLGTHIFTLKSMNGLMTFNKYDEKRNIFAGLSDTLLMPNPTSIQQSITKMSVMIGMVDSQNRYLWKTVIRQDTMALHAYRREHNPYFIGRTKDGGIICGGQRTDVNAFVGATEGYYGGWIMKLDSTGNILWDRMYYYPYNPALNRITCPVFVRLIMAT